MHRWFTTLAVAASVMGLTASTHAQRSTAPQPGAAPNLANPLGVGTSPATTVSPTFTPGLGFDETLNGFAPGFGFAGGSPFFFTTNPFFDGFNPFFGGVVTWTPDTRPLSGSPVNPGALVANPASRLPILGVNTRIVAAGRPARGRASRTAARSRRRSRAQASIRERPTQRRLTVVSGDSSPASTRVAARMNALMRTGPMTSGRVVRADRTGVSVSLTVGGRAVTRHYALSDVFFYRGSELMDGASHRSLLAPGLQVMVPDRPSAT